MPKFCSDAILTKPKTRTVSTTTIAGYGAGDFGFNLYYAGLNLYLLYYYTDVLNIDPAIAGLIFMIPVIWDGISDPLMGWLATRTRTRFGKFRPYILFGAPVMGLSFVGMFAAPVWFPDHLVVACLVSHILFRTMYTVCSVPYSALAAALTFDSGERNTMAGVRMVAAMLGGIATAASMLELANYFDGSDVRSGFIWVAVVYALLATVMMSVIFMTTTEHAVAPDETHLTSQQTLAFLKANTAFWILCSASLIGIIGTTMGGKSFVYYINYYAGQPDAVSNIMSVGILGSALGIPIWTLAARSLSKRLVWIIGGCGAMLGNLMIFMFEIQAVSTLLVLAFCNGFFGGAVAVMFWSMLPDTVEFGQFRTGVRDDGIVFGLCQLIAKAGSGIGVGLIGFLLSFVGYVANQPQGEVALQGIRVAAFLVPAASILCAVVIISWYPLDTSLHRRIVRVLGWRRLRSDRLIKTT